MKNETTFKNSKIAEAVANRELAALEGKAMDWYFSGGLYEGAEAGYSDVTFQDMADGIGENIRTVKGIIGSLTKKGYTWTDDSVGIHIIYTTKKGYMLDDDYDSKWKDQIEGNPFF